MISVPAAGTAADVTTVVVTAEETIAIEVSRAMPEMTVEETSAATVTPPIIPARTNLAEPCRCCPRLGKGKDQKLSQELSAAVAAAVAAVIKQPPVQLTFSMMPRPLCRRTPLQGVQPGTMVSTSWALGFRSKHRSSRNNPFSIHL